MFSLMEINHALKKKNIVTTLLPQKTWLISVKQRAALRS